MHHGRGSLFGLRLAITLGMPPSDIYIARSARLWIQQYGTLALVKARQKVEEMRRSVTSKVLILGCTSSWRSARWASADHGAAVKPPPRRSARPRAPHRLIGEYHHPDKADERRANRPHAITLPINVPPVRHCLGSFRPWSLRAPRYLIEGRSF
jgi:hypothetical protein